MQYVRQATGFVRLVYILLTSSIRSLLSDHYSWGGPVSTTRRTGSPGAKKVDSIEFRRRVRTA